jgi:hypothetical protein
VINLRRNNIGLLLIVASAVLAAHGCGLNPQPEPPLGAPTAGGLGEDNMGPGSPNYGADGGSPVIPPNAAGDGDLASGDGDPSPGDGDVSVGDGDVAALRDGGIASDADAEP